MANRDLLRLSSSLLVIGELLTLAAGILHPDREPANSHAAVFSEYAASADWTLVHLGQFVGMAVIVAGLLALFYALSPLSGTALWVSRFGAVSAVVALALYGVLQSVDGVALKQAVNAWVSAPDTEKAARFASAETMRWLEWGTRSYQSFVLGASLTLFATAVVFSARVPRPIGYLMVLSGLAYIAQCFVLGSEGFSTNNTIPTLGAYVTFLAWSIWLLIVAWRMKADAIEVAPVEAPMRSEEAA